MDTIVTNRSFHFKSLTRDDDKTVRYLLESYPEPGLVATLMQMRTASVGQAFDLIRPGSYSLGAFLSKDISNLAGIIYGWPHQIQIKGHQYPALLIYGLVIQPQFRNTELEPLLRSKLLEWANQKFDKEKLIVYAYTQKPGPDEQPKVTGKKLALTPVKTLSMSPPNTGTHIREAQMTDLPNIAKGLNEFYKDDAFYIPQTDTALSYWLNPRKLDENELALTKYYVVSDKEGIIQAGLGIFDTTQLYDVKVVKVPLLVSLVNKLLKIIPEDGYLRLLQVSRIWYNQGQLSLAQELWKEVRKTEKARAGSLVVSFDPAGSLKDIFNLSFTHLTSKLSLIVHQAPGGLEFSNSLLAPYES